MQVNPVQALQAERNVPVQHVVDCDRHRPLEPGRHGNLRDVAYTRRMRLPARERLRNPQPRRYQAEPVWEPAELGCFPGVVTGWCAVVWWWQAGRGVWQDLAVTARSAVVFLPGWL